MFLLVILFAFIISGLASARVKSTYLRYNQVPASSGYTGAEAARAILQRSGIYDVDVVEGNQMLGDHYDPTNKRLVLSTENFRGTSVAALGVAAHECGHAIQHKEAYAPLQWRVAAVSAVTFVNPMLSYLPFLGFMHLAPWHSVLFFMSIGMGVIMLFNLVTLPVEFDASNRAKQILPGMGFISSQAEMTGVKKTLDAAGLTYVAAFLTSVLYFLMYFLPLILGGNRRNSYYD